MAEFTQWQTKDGRRLPIPEMSDLHLLNTLKAIEEGRVFAPMAEPDPNDPGARVVSYEPFDNMNGDMVYPIDPREWNSRRRGWIAAFRDEAERRGLDSTKPPKRTVGLVDWLTEGLSPKTAAKVKAKLTETAIAQPEIDVSNLDGKVTYLHWQAGGTPVEGTR